MTTLTEKSFLNISSYKFIHLENLAVLQQHLLAEGRRMGIMGTILLAPEGINLMLAAEQNVLKEYLSFITQDPRFADLRFKESFSSRIPFIKLKVRIKPEIITTGDETLNPLIQTGQYLNPTELKNWLDVGQEVVILDTRNNYEVAFGTFQNAINLNIENFQQFPEAIQGLDESLKEKPIVMFCTGGVRCEKASAMMLRQGFKTVYQLQGGILDYFAECGDAHYQGDCFVFDERVALTPKLEVVK